MDVYFTVDTEFWPRDCARPDFAEAEEDYRRDVFGLTRSGEYGIGYQMDALESEGLKGVFFIESLHALKLGTSYVRTIVELVQRRGHEAALHLHPEWVGWLEDSPLGGRNSPFLHAFPAADQRWIVGQGARVLRECGVRRIASFRAGNYGADQHTLRALADEGVPFDSSYNVAFTGGGCGLDAGTALTMPRRMEGVIEVPIAFVRDGLGRFRPMQIVAASFGEMRAALDQAERRGFPAFVFVSHGFELIRRRAEARGGAQEDGIVRRRFDQLIGYLGRNKERYRVTTFADTVPEGLFRAVANPAPVTGSAWQTSGRLFEQAWRRVGGASLT